MNDRTGLWFRSKIILLGLAVAAVVGALVVMYFAFYAFMESNLDSATLRYLVGLSLVVVALLVIALFCMGILLIRDVAYATFIRSRLGGATEYVDAWRLAGERLQLDDVDDGGGENVVELDPFDGDFDEGDDEEGERDDDDLLGL